MYIDPELIDDESAVAEGILAVLADILEGWEASEGHVETGMAEGVGIVSATIAALIKLREREDYTGFGENVLGLPRHPADVAQVTATITLNTDEGGEIPAGFEFVLATPAGEEYAFATTATTVVPATQTEVDVTADALEAGAAPNGAVGEAIEHDSLAIIDTVTATPAAGGSDEETIPDYAARVADRARRVRALPITPEDHAVMATDVAWVARALAVNLADPAQPGVEALGHVTIYPVDLAGQVGTSEQVDELQAYYDTLELVMGATVHLAERDEVGVTVVAQVRPAAGYSDEEAETAAETAIQAGLNHAVWNYDENAPARWATPPNAKTQLTVFDVSALIDDLAELSAVISVTLNGTDAPIAVPLTSLLAATSVTVEAV